MNRIFKEIVNSSLPILSNKIWDDQLDHNITIPIDPSIHTTPNNEDGWQFEVGAGKFSYFKYDGYRSCVYAYEKCPPVSAIINRKAQAFTNGKVWVLNSKGKVAESVQATALRRLLSKPNSLQSWKAFEAQAYIYMQVFGFAIILPIKPAGFTENIDTSSLWNIPASWIDIEATQERFTKLGGVALSEIVVNFNGNKIILKLNELIIIKDITPSFKTLTFPASKLQAMSLPINNVIGAYESRNILINYRGALGILSADPGKGQYVATPMTPEQKLELQKDFRRYGLKAHQFQVILTTASLKWQQMGYATKDLMLMEEVQESTKSICDGLNFPPHLLGLIDPTFNNQEAAEQGLYNNAAIPDGESFYEQLSAWFKLENYNLVINKDFSHIPVLQKDKVKEAEAQRVLTEALKLQYDAGLITKDEWCISLGLNPLPNGMGGVRSTDAADTKVPLASIIGVGGVQGLIQVLTAAGLSNEARAATLEIVFGVAPADALRMSEGSSNGNQNGNQQEQMQGQQGSSGTEQEDEEETNS